MSVGFFHINIPAQAGIKNQHTMETTGNIPGKKMLLKPERIHMLPGSVFKSTQDIADAYNNDPDIGMGDYVWENFKLPDFESIKAEGDIYYIILSLHQLKLKKGAYYKTVISTGFKKGLNLIPKESVFQLRLDYKNQPAGETCNVAMEPILAKDRQPFVFRLYHHALVRTDNQGKKRKNILLLNGVWDQERFFQPEELFAFQAWKPEMPSSI